MPFVTSRDGTRIAYSKIGKGSPVILIDGAMCFRASGPMEPIAKLLAPDFTVITYDRRGRGESGDTLPYAPEREIEDIAALIDLAGGKAALFGISSGGGLALEAANRLETVTRLIVYEAPFVVDGNETPLPGDFRQRLQDAVDTGHPGDAVKLFMQRVRVPAFAIFIMRFTKIWKTLTGIAHTLPYDIAIIEPHNDGRPLEDGTWANIKAPALIVGGGKSPTWMQNAQKDIARVLPGAKHQTLPGQTHMVKAEALAPMLAGFLK